MLTLVETDLACLVCKRNIRGLDLEGSCPDCGHYVRRTVELSDAPHALSCDELRARIPTLQEVFDCIEYKGKLEKDSAEAIERAKQAIEERIVTAAIQAGDRPNIRNSLIREFYWRGINIKWISQAFDLTQHEVRKFAGTMDSQTQCAGCGAPIMRECRMGHLEPHYRNPHTGNVGPICRRCQEAESERRNAQYCAERELERNRHYELQSMPYAEYLQTPEWQSRRAHHLRAAGYRCQVCNSGNIELHVHHRTYERRGCEYFKDLIVLCANCHGIFHREGKLATDRDYVGSAGPMQ